MLRGFPSQLSVHNIWKYLSVNEECLPKLMLFGEPSLRHVLSHYAHH